MNECLFNPSHDVLSPLYQSATFIARFIEITFASNKLLTSKKENSNFTSTS